MRISSLTLIAFLSATSLAQDWEAQYNNKRQSWEDSVQAAEIEVAKAIASAQALGAGYEAQYGPRANAKRQDWQSVAK